MIRRLFWILLGMLLGVWALRRVDRMAQAARPGTVARRTGQRVGGTQARWQDAVAAGRTAAREREAQLRAAYGVPGIADLAEGRVTRPDHPES